jgi:hypothetical protein
MAKRPKARLATSPSEQAQLLFNEASFSTRNLDVGGVYEIIGTAATAKRVGYFATLRVVNNAGAAAFIAVGASTVAAPTGLTDGHWIAPNGELMLSTGDQGDYVRASAGTVGVYKLKESIVVADEDRQTQV